MEKFTLPILMLILSLVSFIGLVLLVENSKFGNIKTEADCDVKDVNIKDGHLCGVWADGTCFKGKLDTKTGNCVKPKSVPGIVLMVSTGIFLLAFIVTLIRAYMK
jgi:hypothetical protein